MSEIKTIAGDLVVTEPIRIGVLASRFNDLIVDRLQTGCIDTLLRHGIRQQDLTVVKVPGAFELPMIAKCMATGGKYDALIVLGAVIRGATPHFEHIAGACSSVLAQLSIACEIPITFGVLTVDNLEQAIERAGTKAGNKGSDAATAALEMVSLMRKL